MVKFFALEFDHPAPEVIEVEYKHVECSICGTYPLDRVGGTTVRFTKKSELADFSRTAQGILARQSVIEQLTQSRISGWRPGCVQIESASRLKAQDLHYYELVIVGHTVGYSEHVHLRVEKKCEECGRQRFSYPQTGLVLPLECWDRSDLFVIEELGIWVVTEDFRRVVEMHQFTGLGFIPLDEWRDPFGSFKD